LAGFYHDFRIFPFHYRFPIAAEFPFFLPFFPPSEAPFFFFFLRQMGQLLPPFMLLTAS